MSFEEPLEENHALQSITDASVWFFGKGNKNAQWAMMMWADDSTRRTDALMGTQSEAELVSPSLLSSLSFALHF